MSAKDTPTRREQYASRPSSKLASVFVAARGKKVQLNLRLGQACGSTSGTQRVQDHAGDRHGSDAAWHRRHRTGNLQGFGKIHVADKPRLAAFARHPIDADIDHG